MKNDYLFDVSERVVLITGAAGMLGSGYCAGFLSRGATVIGMDLKESSALREFPADRFHFFSSDITDRDSVMKVLEGCRSLGKIPDVLINNAAIDSPPDSPVAESGPFEFYPESSFDRVMDVNVKGTFLCSQIFGGEMATRSGGSIINISSIYGVVSPDQSIYEYRRKKGEEFFKPVAYSVSKSAIRNLTRYLAVYWAKKNIRVNTLVLAGVENQQDPEFLRAYTERIPIGRMAGREDYLGACLFLASRASEYMTGSELTIDGGWTAI